MKLVVVLILTAAIIGGAIFLSSKLNTSVNPKKTSSKTLVPIESVNDPAVVQKSTAEVNNLVEIPNKDKAKVYLVNDKKAVEAKNSIFKKAYKGDLIVLLPDKTIIYDPSTKTIRDISNVILYESF